MNSRAILRLATLTLAFHCVTAPAASIFGAYLWLGTTNATYDASGTKISETTLRIFYDRHGTRVGSISTTFFSSPLGLERRSFRTNVIHYSEDGSFLSNVTDSITLSNGYPFFTEHEVATNSVTTNGVKSVTVEIITRADSTTVETITTSMFESSSDYRQLSRQVRTGDGQLLSWSVRSWTNDPVHMQEFSWFAFGETNETTPDWIFKITNTFDSLGNVILSTDYMEFDGYVSSSWTSNSYVIGENEKVLSSISQTDYETDGTIDSITTTTFTYDKKANLTQQTSKTFAGDGTLQAHYRSVFDYDQFGNLEFEESTFLDANGAVISRRTTTNAFVPRGRAFDRSKG